MPRPPLSDSRKTDSPLRIRLTEQERAVLDRAATQASLPTSAWARQVLLAATKGKRERVAR